MADDGATQSPKEKNQATGYGTVIMLLSIAGLIIMAFTEKK